MNKVATGFLVLFIVAVIGTASVFSYQLYRTPPLTLIVYMGSDDYPAFLKWSATRAMYAFHPREDEVETLNAEAGARYAALYPDHEQAEQLLSHFLDNGVNINSLDNATGSGVTALHSAVLDQSPYAVKLLLEYGAEPEKADLQGRTPLDFAKVLSEKQPSETANEVIRILEASVG